jgi:hypothetical protein
LIFLDLKKIRLKISSDFKIVQILKKFKIENESSEEKTVELHLAESIVAKRCPEQKFNGPSPLQSLSGGMGSASRKRHIGGPGRSTAWKMHYLPCVGEAMRGGDPNT